MSSAAAPSAPVPVVLASGSSARAAVLRGAGVPFVVERSAVDEAMVKDSMKADGADAAATAQVLAEMKAQRVSARHPDRLVIGADQMLECNGVWFDKPPDRAHARAHLDALRGRSHDLISAVCVVKDGALIWHVVETATLTMRAFSDAFLDSYLARIGDEALESVGGYRLEGLGAQLFARIEGDYFTVLGLPLLPLLDFLRGHGVVEP